MEFILGELFSGPGGMSYGAVKSKVKDKNGKIYSIKHGWASDYDSDTCATYLKNVPGCKRDAVICTDVRELDIDKLKKINAFAYGFPCNDFSLVGKQKGFNGKFGPLYTYGLKVNDVFNPHFFVAENVSGITSANSGDAFKKILNDLSKSGKYGYNLTVHLYKAEQYAVPQTRHRMIIVGIRKDHGLIFRVPSPITPNREDYITARMAFEIPPIPVNAFNNEITRQGDLVVERLSYIKPGENVWSESLPKHLRLNVTGARLSQIYKKLHPDKPSYTITGSGGGGTHGYHYAENRALTNRERARIQTFPDTFEFVGSKESVRKQIGMAVPVKLSNVVFTSILKTFGKVKYSSIESNYPYDNN
jgi:DNA (cytosine-5)-methyltransferase 1